MTSEKGWIVDGEMKELIELLATENHEILPKLLRYAIELLQYEFGDSAELHFCIGHDPEDGSRTVTLHVRMDKYEDSEQDPVTHEYLPHTFWGRMEKVQNCIWKKFPPTSYRVSKLHVNFLLTTDFMNRSN